VNQPLILSIETATDICSVSLSEGDRILDLAESGPDRSHATLLNPYIRKVTGRSGYSTSDIDAVAVGKGPGSYTGLRIGVSTAKGIAYALQIPLISFGTLENMAHGALGHPEVIALAGERADLRLCPLLDARRMEVYSAFFTMHMETIRDVSADVVDGDTYREILRKGPVCFFGSGALKCRDVIRSPNAYFVDGIHPSAGFIAKPVAEKFRKKQFEDVAYFEPFYLKDFVATTPRKKVL
jgi:tRNA threonylcarbamoyladenosine biosynthesis protein TsaB